MNEDGDYLKFYMDKGFYIVECTECDAKIPFGSEREADEWEVGHREGHALVL